MKRLIAAVSFAALAVPALAAEYGLPYEKTQFDRGFLAEQGNGASSPTSGGSAKDPRAPYEQVQIDRGVPPYTVPHEHAVKDPVWGNHQSFIAPPQ